MADEPKFKPSFMTSSFTLLTVLTTLSYVGLCIYMKDSNSLKELVFMLLGGIGIIKGMKMGGQKP